MILPTTSRSNLQWVFTESVANNFLDPSQISENQNWLNAIVPGTVALSLQCLNLWDINQNKNFDSSDWWYRCNFNLEKKDTKYLYLNGLASLCDIWLNDKKILSTDNMFRSYKVDISDTLQDANTIYLCFRSLTKNLELKRSRPAWKTKLVNNQQLRWLRTSLLGKIPGWTPPVSAVGPWKSVNLSSGNDLDNINIQNNLKDNGIGQVLFSCNFIKNTKMPNKAIITINNQQFELNIISKKTSIEINGDINVTNIKAWMPHTHGKSNLYEVKLELEFSTDSIVYSLTNIGFKNTHLEMNGNDFSINVNGKKIFCRGAVWTTNDIVSHTGEFKELHKTLSLMKNSGANMIRIGGTMCYEQEEFYTICDELGIMIWQDFMFANMDYPSNDEHFLKSVTEEIKQQVNRFSSHPCITLYCGNSEIQQQVSMLGLTKNTYNNNLFDEIIPAICSEKHKSIPYIASTPIGGTLPIHTDKNLSHYYGVGAYLSDISELRRHDVKFTSECLGFSNIPNLINRNSIFNGENPVFHHPEWKKHTPRDSSAGWDFEDVRDHYLHKLYSIDAISCRSFDPDTYLKYSEMCSGEIMSQSFNEWRSSHSNCSGALVWFLKDFWAGAGWGIIDSNNMPKSCYYFLKRCWQPISVHITDESLNGIHIHCNNESSDDITVTVRLDLINNDYACSDTVTEKIIIKRNSSALLDSSSLFNHFVDINYRYKFGAPQYTAVVASLIDENNVMLNQSTLLTSNKTFKEISNTVITVNAAVANENCYEVILTSEIFVYGVCVDSKDCIASDNYFNLLPNEEKTITLEYEPATHKKLKAYVSAINISGDIKIKILNN